jgi:acyl carrier protein
MTTTFEQLRAILVKDYQLAPDAVMLDAPFEALGIDSLGTAELLFNVEDAFKITVPSRLVELVTVGDVVRYIDELIAAQKT